MNFILIGEIDSEMIMTAEQKKENSNPNPERCWSRIDPKANRFQLTDKGDPKWSNVKRRETVCLKSGQVIEDIKITDDLDEKFLTHILPIGTNGVATRFYFDIDPLL